jgi:hypothetical protein
VLLYVNGLPLVFIELKNSNVKLRTAFDKNLVEYRDDIAQLFVYNAFLVLSNAIETRIGSMTAGWDHFFHWLRPRDILMRDGLTKTEEQKIKNAARALLERLSEGKPVVLVEGWERDTQIQQCVRSVLETVLDRELPDTIGRAEFVSRTGNLMDLLVARAGNVGAGYRVGV